MKISARHRILITSFFVGIIGWIFVGMLVNFHQHQLFGKMLIQQLQPIYVSKKGASVLDFKKFGPKELLPGYDIDIDNQTPISAVMTLPLSFEKTCYQLISQIRPLIFDINQRGPPSYHS